MRGVTAKFRIVADEAKEDRGSWGRINLPARKFSPGKNILFRVFLALAALLITTLLVYVERGCYSMLGQIGQLSFVDALYFATVTLTTTGYGDIVPVCESSRIVNALVITPLRFVFLIVLVGTTFEVLTRRTREQFAVNRWRNTVSNHTVIIGFGVKGRTAAKTLLDSGYDRSSIVVVSLSELEIKDATRQGLVGVHGDGRREEVLREAMIERASKVVISTDQDDTNVLVTLTARRLAPTAEIVASVRENENADVLRQSGANTVIPTADAAGHLMGISLMSPITGQLMEDILSTGHGLEVGERAVRPDEYGKTRGEIDASGDLVLAVIRNGVVHRFDQDGAVVLQAGDHIVSIHHVGQ